MSKKRVLITGGAGFIGSRLAELLSERGHYVVVYDNLNPQVHGLNADFPQHLKSAGITLIKADVTDRATLEKSLSGIDVVVHLAAETGVGQSMYEIGKYVKTNVTGTGILLDILANARHTVRKVVLASSRAVYGEGKYECRECGVVYPLPRSLQQVKDKAWEMNCPKCGGPVKPLPTDEDSPLRPGSIYAITKHAQEQLVSNFGDSLGIPCVILRYQNVYGPGQSLSNPYTGILSIFSTRIMNDKPPLIFEDGKESRDFVYIDDVVAATTLAVENEESRGGAFNVGVGRGVSILEVADLLLRKFNSLLKPLIVEKSRAGDIRHCFADLTKVRKVLGYKPKFDVDEGLTRFVSWVKAQGRTVDLSEKANEELEKKGLFK